MDASVAPTPELLFAQHRLAIYRYLCRVTGHAETANDLTQDVFLRVTRAGVPDTDEGGRKAWLYRIARNLAINHRRDEGRRPAIATMPGAHRAIDRPVAATQELGVALAQALETLSEAERDVFLLRESAGLSYEEIAASCDLTMTAVRSRLHRARQHLRETLGSALHTSLPSRGRQDDDD